MTSARNDPSIDHALSLLLAEETEEALRWAAGIVERDPQAPAALMVTSQLLQQMGRTRAATEGLELSFQRAIAQGDLPLAMAAIDGLREVGVDVLDLQRVAAATFSFGSSRVDLGANVAGPPPDELKPLSPFLTGPALASQATGILRTARGATEDGGEPPLVAPIPLFGALSTEALMALLDAFHAMTVPAGYVLIKEGAHVPAVYVLARGQVEIHRRTGRDKPSVPVSRMEDGAFFGEMALLGEVPAPYSVVATRPSIVLIADRHALEAVAARHPSVATQLDAHCRRRLLASLGRSADLLQAVPADRRASLVDRFEVRVFPRGASLMREGAEVEGLYLIASGEVTISAREGMETVVLASLGAGETVGDVELVLCRRATSGAVAAAPTATLFLPRSCFESLVRADPVTAHGVYLNAVRKAAETTRAMEAPTDVAEAYVLDDEVRAPTELVTADPFPPPPTGMSIGSPMPPPPGMVPLAGLVTRSPTPPPVIPPFPATVRLERPAATSSPTPTAESPSSPPSSLAPTAASRRPAAIAPPSTAPPAWRQGAQYLVTMGAVSLALGVLLTVLVTRSDPRGAAAGSPAPSAGTIAEADPADTVSNTPPTSSSSPASAASLAPARPNVAARAPSKAARIPPPVAPTAPPPAPPPSSAAPSPKPSAAPPSARPNAAAAADDFGDRQ
jgi:CRP-like cAMP-binding protein